MSPTRLSAARLPRVVVFLLWLVVSSVSAGAGPADPASGAHRLAAISTSSFHALRQSLSQAARRLGWHSRHDVRLTISRDARNRLHFSVDLRPDEGEQAVQTGPVLPRLEERVLPGPPLPSAPLSLAGRLRVTGRDYFERRTPRGPPIAA
ncbi:MAG TPA: hypothetical protein VNE16_04305 [Vicinamibacterales bacterium]|nr:hypothetical protein [Vicinamibacterales bacterium]